MKLKPSIANAAQRWLALFTVLLAFCGLPQVVLADEAPVLSAQGSTSDKVFYSGVPSTSSNSMDIYVSARYNDEYFSKDASVFNSDLAYSSMCLAASTFNSNRYGEDYTKKSVNIQTFLNNVGCKDISVNIGYTTRPMDKANIGVAIGHKTLFDNSTELFVVGIRGGNYQAEWAGNVRVGKSGFHQGFAEARDSVLAFILPYIQKYHGGRTVKVWISGYSRSGAVSNLVGGWLDSWLKDNDVAGVSPTVEYAENYSKDLMRNTTSKTYDLSGVKMSAKNIYCYPVNAPQGATTEAASAAKSYCVGIHNLINADDWIPQVAPYINSVPGFNFARYGTDHDITGTYSVGDSLWATRFKSVWQSKGYTGGDNKATMDRFRYITGRPAIPWRFRQFYFSKNQFIPQRVALDGVEYIYNKFKKKEQKGERFNSVLNFDKKGEGNRYMYRGKELVDMQGAYFNEFIRFFVDACGVRSREDYVNKLQPTFEYLMAMNMGETKSTSDKFNARLSYHLMRNTKNQKPNVVAYKLLGGLVNKTTNLGSVGLMLLGAPIMHTYLKSSEVQIAVRQSINEAYADMKLPYSMNDIQRAYSVVSGIISGIYNKEQSIGKLNFYHILTLLSALDTIGQGHMPELAIAWHPDARGGNAVAFQKNQYLNGSVLSAMASDGETGGSDYVESRSFKKVYLYDNNDEDYNETNDELIGEYKLYEEDDLIISSDTYELEGYGDYDSTGNVYKAYYEAPERTGYILSGWATGPYSDQDSMLFDVDYAYDYEEVSGDKLILFAQWVDDATWVEAYHANRNAADNEVSYEYDIADNDMIGISDNDYTNSGYTFVGWNTKADGTGIALQPKAGISLADAGLTSRDEMHRRLDSVDENDTVTLNRYVDEATLHLYAQWSKDGDGGQQGGGYYPYTPTDYTRTNVPGGVYTGYYGGSWTSSSGSSSTGSSSTTSSATSSTTSTAKGTKPINRLSGTNRYSTMAYVSAAVADTSDWVIIVSGANFPDALSASALAGAHHAPIILTESGALTAEAKEQIERLNPSHVIIVGGDAAVSAEVEASVKSMVADVTRVFGADRTETSVEGFKAARAANGSSETVIVATGKDFADALSAGAWVWVTSTPVVLTGNDGLLTASEVEAIRADAGIKRIVILGGTGAVSDGVMQQLGDSYAYVRLGGADRYETSSKIAEWATANGLNWTRPVVATGRGFADALCGSALAGTFQSPILLIDASTNATMETLRNHSSSVSGAFILGGTSAIPQALADAVSNTIG